MKVKNKLKAIVGVNQNGYIGKDGKMLWHSTSDLKHFFDKTKNSTCIVGRKTFESLPESVKTSGNRTYLVVSKNTDKGISLEQALLCNPEWVIGGAELYELTKPLWRELHVSNINDNQIGDTIFTKNGLPNDCLVIEYNFDVDGKV